MKKIIKILLILLIHINSYAQIEQQSEYKYKYYAIINTHILEEYECELAFNKNSSLFVWKKTGDTSLQATDEGGCTRAEHLRDGNFEFLEKKKDTIICKDVISKKEFHFIKQEKPILNWEITDVEKLIGGYKCIKALTSYKGREYTAWYSPSIPASYGPWKLSGLPGLILEAYDTKKEIFFSLKEIKKNFNPIIVDVTKEEFISLREFYQRMVDYPFETLSKIQSKAAKGSTIVISNIKYNFVEKDYEILGKKEFKE